MRNDARANVPRPRGRPRSKEFSEGSYAVHFRIPLPIFDRYCKLAIRTRQSVDALFKRLLIRHAPRESGVSVGKKSDRPGAMPP